MPTADLNSRAQTLIRAARKDLQPGAGERERLEALLNARIGSGARESRLSQSPPRSRNGMR